MKPAAIALACAVLLAALPFVASNYIVYLASLIAISAILAIGLDMLTGWTGQISLGHAGFAAVGGYASWLMVIHWSMPFWLALPLGALCAALVSLVIGFPCLRLSGHYLALATFGFGEVIQLVIVHAEKLTNGPRGLPVPTPSLGPISLASDRALYYFIVSITAVLVILAWNLSRSSMGRALLSIRTSELAASSVGINLPRYKTLAFALSAFYAGIAGGLIGAVVKFLEPGSFGVWQSILYLMMIAIGGMRSIPGAIIGAALLTVLPEALGGLQHYMELGYGVLLLVFIIFIPEGIWGRVASTFRNWRSRAAVAPRTSA